MSNVEESKPELSQEAQNQKLHEVYTMVLTVLNAGTYSGALTEKVYGAKTFIQQNIAFLDKIMTDSKPTPEQKATEAVKSLGLEVVQP